MNGVPPVARLVVQLLGQSLTFRTSHGKVKGTVVHIGHLGGEPLEIGIETKKGKIKHVALRNLL